MPGITQVLGKKKASRILPELAGIGNVFGIYRQQQSW